MSCSVHTMGLPEAMIFSTEDSESIPSLIQCRCITSACLNSGSSVMSVPEWPKSMEYMRLRRKCVCNMIEAFSHSLLRWLLRLCSLSTVVTCSVLLLRTSILALMPLFFKASVRR